MKYLAKIMFLFLISNAWSQKQEYKTEKDFNKVTPKLLHTLLISLVDSETLFLLCHKVPFVNSYFFSCL